MDARPPHRRALVAGAIASGLCAGCARAAPAVRADLYQCEAGYCETALERDPASLDWRASLPEAPGERLILRGAVTTHDTGAPAPGVVIYAHHTNAEGLYADGGGPTEWSRRHGRLRGWVRTGADGRYEFRTIKPAPYPNQQFPAHIHLIVVEPGRRPYWIDDVVFEGEFRVDATYRSRAENRSGDGVVRLSREGDAWLAARNIRLEPHPA